MYVYTCVYMYIDVCIYVYISVYLCVYIYIQNFKDIFKSCNCFSSTNFIQTNAYTETDNGKFDLET